MRRKITIQILGLLLVILPVMYISLLIFSVLIFSNLRNTSGEGGALYTRASEMTIAFEQNLKWQNSQVWVTPDKLDELHSKGIWLQVLDENGTEIYEQYKPASAPLHYTPAELILNYKYSGAIKDSTGGYTLFVAMADRGERKFSYILGFPDRDVIKATLYANPRTFYVDVFMVLGGALVIVTLIITVLAFLYGSWVASKLADIIDGIHRLAQGNFTRMYAETGVYANVYQSMNRLTAALQLHEKERQHLETAREEWIANISHDVKTPLSSLKGYAELLADPEYHFNENEVREYAQIMQEKSIYMDSLVEDLRLTYQLKNATLPLKKRSENLVELLREAVIDVLNDPRYSDAPLRFEPACEEIRFDCDKRLLQRAFTNLILNALVHNPPGTPVMISIAGGKRLCICFEDQGRGIPAEEIEHLFDRYYRGTNTSESHQGSGLGMAIAKEIIQANGGRLEVSSQINQGTRIEITFPG